jgi:transcriptional regulator of acetoin/glycerol metabolism
MVGLRREQPVTQSSVSSSDPFSDQRDVALSRERFLTAELPREHGVRGAIVASWERSSSLAVAADRIEMRHVPDLRLDSRLSTSAEPVLRSLRTQLEGQSVSVILTDPTGLVLSRLTGDGELERHLDRVLLAPGFSYAEKYVGTNGIGTALEVGGPTHVFGHEHYAENLEDLACAGVPIHHPISGRLVGAVDLTCWRKDAGALLLTLAKTTAEQIRQSLLADAGARQLELFQEYLRTCSRRTGAVFALNSDVVMLNAYARTTLSPEDQAVLLTHAAETPVQGHHGVRVVALPSGDTARMYCRYVPDDQEPAGVVAHVQIRPAADPQGPSTGRDAHPRMPLPGLVGTAPPWLHVCVDLENTFRRGEWVAVEGEPGVGKLALLRAVQLRRQPVGRFVLLDAVEAATDPDWAARLRRAVADDADSLVVRHVDRLDAPRLRHLVAALRESRHLRQDRPLWASVTLGTGPKSPELTQLLQLFPSTLVVPPLRLHLDDLQLLVPVFLSRLARGGHLVCSPAAMRLLMRMAWPGNAEELRLMLAEVVTHRRTGRIEAEDLPPQVHAVSRRVLSNLESMERDAIVRSLTEASGNKLQAARSLGMSRATIYRKIHDYGIVLPGT